MKPLIALAALALAACESGGAYRPSAEAPTPKPAPLPDGEAYGAAIGAGEIRWSARTLADDFVQIVFYAEDGRRYPSIHRWPGPVRVAIAAPSLAPYRSTLEALAARIGREAPNARVVVAPPGEADEAEIVIRGAPRDAIRRTAPDVRCFFAPHRGDLASYDAARLAGAPGWSREGGVEAITIYVPDNPAPFEARTCIEEEVMQALGLRNDLHRLEDTIFNDDAAHAAATATDMAMLQALYDPRFDASLGEEAARRAATPLFAELTGGADRRLRRPVTDRVFAAALGELLRADDATSRRRASLRLSRAVEDLQPDDHRRGVALIAEAAAARKDGRQNERTPLLRKAKAHFARTLGPRNVRAADAGARLGAALFRDGLYGEAVEEFEAAVPILIAHRRDEATAHSLRVWALALGCLTRFDEAHARASEALAWAAYAYGSEGEAVRDWRRAFRESGIRP
ncbi:MAG: DUF2927 domain-containing protein [Pseudomonadota bacterium]